MNAVEVARGDGPVVLAFPHAGTLVPDAVHAALNARGRILADTDWHIDRLYAGLRADVTTVRATFHRYVIDANRDTAGGVLYPGQNTTGLIPLTDFDGRDIWQAPPDARALAERVDRFHAPYHRALRAELERVHRRHGVALLYDCHSIRSQIPFLFEGVLPDFNIGTNDATSCDARIASAVAHICATAAGYSSVVNGRFKGGWTTRHYGQPAQGLHAVQMELAQSSYLTTQAPPWRYDAQKAEKLRVHLKTLLDRLTELAPQLKGMT